MANNQNMTVFAALNNGKNTIIGKVINFSDEGLTLQSISDGDVDLGSLHKLDIYSSEQFYFRRRPVEIVADDKFIDEKSFSKMTARNITIRYHKDGNLKNFKSKPNPVVEKLVKWLDDTGGSKPINVTKTEAQEIFRWMGSVYDDAGTSI